jgi:hypothetical protein
MRTRALLVALLALTASAGCFGRGADEPHGPPAGTTPLATATPEPAPATPTDATPTNATPTAPAPATPAPEPLPRKVIYNATFDFTQGDPTGQSPKVEASQPVPAGYGNVTVNVTITRGGAAPTPLPISGAVNSPMVRVLDPAGMEVLAEGMEGAARNETFAAGQGSWTIRFEGAGTLRAMVVLTASA